MRIIDVHSHILPVDDGAGDYEDALDTVRNARQQGVEHMYATPHGAAFTYDAAYVRRAFGKLSDLVRESLPGMKLSLGCEIRCSVNRMPAILEGLEGGIYPTLEGTDIVLMEFETFAAPAQIIFCLKALRAAGYTPLVAHIERYRRLFADHELIKGLHSEGILFQVNSFSLTDEPDEEIGNRARFLLREEMIDLLGSDTHGMLHRPPMWENAVRYIEMSCSEWYAERILQGHALSGCRRDEN